MVNKKNKAAKNSCFNSKIKNDIIFIFALLLLISIIGIATILFRSEGAFVTVSVDGKSVGSYNLDNDLSLEILTGENDNQINRLVIKDGRAFVSEATCPDGICAKHKPIFREGESIVCLPHKVVITVKGIGNTDTPDIIS